MVLGDGESFIQVGQNEKVGAWVHSNLPPQEQKAGGFYGAKGLSRKSFRETEVAPNKPLGDVTSGCQRLLGAGHPVITTSLMAFFLLQNELTTRLENKLTYP